MKYRGQMSAALTVWHFDGDYLWLRCYTLKPVSNRCFCLIFEDSSYCKWHKFF